MSQNARESEAVDATDEAHMENSSVPEPVVTFAPSKEVVQPIPNEPAEAEEACVDNCVQN